MHIFPYACQVTYCLIKLKITAQESSTAEKKGKRNQTWPYVCAWWTGRHHPGLSPGSHGLSSITVPLSRCQIVTCPACFVIIAKPHKIPPCPPLLHSTSKTSQRKILSETESGQLRWYRRHLFSWNACSRAARLSRSRYPDRNISKPVFSSFACITSHLLRWAMDEQLYEGGRVKDASALIGWRAMVCVWGKVPLAMLDKGGPLPPFLVRLPALSASLSSLSLLPLLLLRLLVCATSCRHASAVLDYKASRHLSEEQTQRYVGCTLIHTQMNMARG